MNKEIQYYIALTMVNGVGAVGAKNLISYCGSAEKIFNTSKVELLKIPGIGNKSVEAITNKEILKEAEKEIEFAEKFNIKILPYTHKDYPKRLTHCNDNPLLIYQKGETQLNASKVVSIVGTRKASHYGKGFVENLLTELKGTDILVVSGMALGIDGQAHKSAVQNGLLTVGVLAHPLNMIYPAVHKNLAKEMLENGGSLITESNTFETMVPGNFPRRNRIVAGMADAVIVVESDIKGGSVITANIANSYNRDVFALPGKYKDKTSTGCNFLVKTYKAQIIENANDLLEQMGWNMDHKKAKKIQRQLLLDLTKDEELIINALKDIEHLQSDEIATKTNLNGSKLASTLLELELKGIIHSLPGNKFSLS